MGISRQSGTKNKSHIGHSNSMNNIDRRTQRGFSLIELIIVISIMAVLIGLIAPQYVKYVRQKREDTCRHNRESALKIYERAVYDGSVPIYLDNASITKVLDGTYKPADAEVSQYKNCPVDSSKLTSAVWHGYISADGSACIKCDTCDNVVSVDMLGWANEPKDPGTDPERPEPETSSEEPDPDEEFTVSFNLNGRGSPQPADQTVKRGKRATKPTDPKADTWTFIGWFTEPALTNEYNFSDPVTADITLYAKWKGIGGGDEAWPYSNLMDWWDPDLIEKEHKGQYDPNNTSLPRDDSYRNNAKIGIWTPQMFTSRTGAQFVIIDVNSNGSAAQLELKEASTPEYYAALHPNYVVQLTGQKTVIDITGKGANDMFNWQNKGELLLPQLTHGDLVEFIDGNTSYMYVYWEGQNQKIINVEEIRSYPNHPQGLYRVYSTPQTVTQ